MAKEDIVTLKDKFNVVNNLLTLIGAEKLCIDDRAFFINIARNPSNVEVCKAIVAACDMVIDHLDTIRTFIK